MESIDLKSNNKEKLKDRNMYMVDLGVTRIQRCPNIEIHNWSFNTRILGWQLKQIITRGSSKSFIKHRLCTHNRTCHLDYLKHNINYVSNNLQLSNTEEGLKSFRREAGGKPLSEVGKRVKVRVYKPK